MDSNNMDFNNIKEQVTHPEDLTDQFSPEDIQKNKIFAILATIPAPPLFWVPIAFNQSSEFGKFYANQGLILALLGVAMTIIASILGAILGLIPVVGVVLSFLVGLACGALTFAGWLLLLIKAIQGKATPLPVIGNLFKVFD